MLSFKVGSASGGVCVTLTQEQIYFIFGMVSLPLALITLHGARRRLTLGPFFGLVGVYSMMLWQTLQTGWWVAVLGLNFNAAMDLFVPPLILGVLLAFMLDGLRASRAYLSMVALMSMAAWGFSVFRETLAQHVPLPYLIVLSNREHLAIIVGLVVAQMGGIASYSVLQARLGVLALPAAAAGAMTLWLLVYSFLHFDVAMGGANLANEWQPFMLASLPTLLLATAYALLARWQKIIMPRRDLRDLCMFWRPATGDNSGDGDTDTITNRDQIVSEVQLLNRQAEINSQLLETHLDHASYGIVITDARQRIRRVNEPARKLMAGVLESKEPARMHLPDVLSRLLGRKVAMVDVVAMGEEHRWPFADEAGGQRWLTLMATPLPQESGYVTRGHYVILKDVTAQVREEERRLLASRIRNIHQTGQVLAHDFSNLLLGVQAQLARLKPLAAQFAEAGEATFAIERALLQAKGLLEQIGSGSQFGTPQLAAHNIHTLANEAAMICRAAAADAGVAIECAPDGNWTVEVDARQMARVLVNLMRNAIRASPPGEKIRVDFLQRGGGIVTRIIDHGAGMSEKDLKLAFDPGYSSKEDGKGGLGLAISYLMVEAHGGSLDLAQNEDEAGLCASIWLPEHQPPYPGLTSLADRL